MSLRLCFFAGFILFFSLLATDPCQAIAQEKNAPVRKVLFKDGKVISARVFKGEIDKLILETGSDRAEPGLMEVSIGEIASIDDSVRLGEMVYRREVFPSTMSLQLEVLPQESTQATALIKFFNDDFETLDFYDLEFPFEIISAIDCFGNPMEFRVEKAQGKNNYRIRLNRPVHPGEEFIFRVLWKGPEVETLRTGVRKLAFRLPQGLPEMTSMHLLLPLDVSAVYSAPSPLLSSETVHGRVLTFQGKTFLKTSEIRVSYRKR